MGYPLHSFLQEKLDPPVNKEGSTLCNTEIHKSKKEQFKSKKSFTEIHLYFDVNKTY